MEGHCHMCKLCDGRACGSTIPGPGAKGYGDGAIRNFKKWKEIRINMDTLTEKSNVDLSFKFLGRKFSAPIFAGPVGNVEIHYGDRYDDTEYNRILLKACHNEGIAAFTGDGMDEGVMVAASETIKEMEGYGIPTLKPWDIETLKKKFKLIEKSGAFAMAMDIDGAGLPFLRDFVPPAGSKSVEQLKEIVNKADRPFILKGIMTKKGADKAIEAGADAIVVSNHGGRVLDQCPATAEVLEDIANHVKGRCKVLVDGGIRDGIDVFKALALGADGVMIARTFVTSIYSGKEEGARAYIKLLKEQLEDTMAMCGAYNISEISKDMIWKK